MSDRISWKVAIRFVAMDTQDEFRFSVLHEAAFSRESPMRMVCSTASVLLFLIVPVHADDFFLTIGGGYQPSSNQASLENNVLYFQRILEQGKLGFENNDIYFSDGDSRGRDLEVIDRASVPKANRLMAEFFGKQSSLGLSYRNHQIPNVRGSTRPESIRGWFQETGASMKPGDRLVLFVTAHGGRSKDKDAPYETTIATWNNSAIKMSEFVGLLDELPEGIDVVAIMVQCHSGGFARLIYPNGDPEQGLSNQRRCGFFATVHDRPAAGCTSEIDESSYVEYSTFFWAALSGQNRSGEPIERPDYDGDGRVSFDEAHAYTILTADTIDLPIKTSGEFLNQFSRFDDDEPNLLTNEESYEEILRLATPVQRVILEGLSEQLGLSGDDRLMAAWKALEAGKKRSRSRGRTSASEADQLRARIAGSLRARWPELANTLNPLCVELVTDRSDEFIAAVEGHKDYDRYRELADAPGENKAKANVKYDRFLRVADNVALAENLRRLGNRDHIAQFESILEAESGTLSQ